MPNVTAMVVCRMHTLAVVVKLGKGMPAGSL